MCRSVKTITVMMVLISFSSSCVLCDGVANGKVVTWIDENANGTFDPGEEPLARVKVGGDIAYTLTDENGEADIGSDLIPGCCDQCWQYVEAVVDVPYGYQPTTPTTQSFTGYDETYHFGFVIDPMVPTPTPYTPKLSCVAYPQDGMQAMAVGPDGTLWLTFRDGVAKFVYNRNRIFKYDIPIGRHSEIMIDAQDSVWIRDEFEIFGRFSDDEFSEFNRGSLIAKSTWSIGSTSDGTVWFLAGVGRSDKIASFTPSTNEWRLYYQEWDWIEAEDQVRVSTNGVIWFAAFDDQAKNSPVLFGEEFAWDVYDIHIFSGKEKVEIPGRGSVGDGLIASDDTVWFIVGDSLLRYLPNKDEWRVFEFPESDEISPDRFSQMAFGPDGSIWITSTSYGKQVVLQFVHDGDEAHWLTYDDRDVGFDNVGYQIAFTEDGELWLAPGDLLRCDILR
jgi:streptogramin lyase